MIPISNLPIPSQALKAFQNAQNQVLGPKANLIPPSELEHLTLRSFSPPRIGGPAETPANFESVLKNLVGEVNQKGIEADDKVRGFYSGKDISLHDAMISVQEASLSFQLMVEVRNKLLDSYKELMRMQM